MTLPLDTASSQTGAPTPLAVKAAPATLATPDASKKGDFTFHDLLETLNPLQHLPLISTAYRAITGDSISPAARIAGDSLYGGIFGLASSIVDSLVEGETGKDIGGHIVATIFGDDDDNNAAPASQAVPQTATTGTPDSNAPTSLLPPTPGASPATAPAPASALSAATAAATAASNAPKPPAPPSDFFIAEQKASHGGRGVALTTTVPVDNHRDAKVELQKKIDAALANAAKASGNPAAVAPATGTTPPATPAPANGPAPTSLLPGSMPTASATPPAVTPGNVATLMLQALDKYKSLDQQRASTTPTPPPVLIN
jgi:hypothetical protein